ncbi:MAG: DUF2817 domain-containing protein [Rhodoferax sp.]|nr:DUF2817 domain-containing protein [Rhodoferax sp.]MBP7493422.1 DUF2817 domain-containing protein [Rhodoferax sp.]
MNAPTYSQATSYPELRTQFLAAAARHGAALHHYPHPLKGMQGEDLFTDVAVLAKPGTQKWLISVSGTHGVEGFYGSMCQTGYLDHLAEQTRNDDVGIVMVHLINPWGTSWKRRVNEDNIDLNRNYLDFTRPTPANPAYESMHALFAPDCATGHKRAESDATWEAQTQAQGATDLRSRLEAGQYQHPDGLYFGGFGPAWSNLTLRKIVQAHCGDATDAISFDLHTGAGAYGHPMLMAIAERDYPGMADAGRIYGEWVYKILTRPDQKTDTGISAAATGYTSQALVDLMVGKRFTQLVIECGTYNGSQVGHKALLDDHFLHLSGALQGAHFQTVKAALLEFFYPTDDDWRELVWVRTRQIFDRALADLAAR